MMPLLRGSPFPSLGRPPRWRRLRRHWHGSHRRSRPPSRSRKNASPPSSASTTWQRNRTI